VTISEPVPAAVGTRAEVQGTAQASIVMSGVSKTYPGTDAPAVAGVDLRIEPGEFFSLLGPSGSGKTTTLRMLAGFEQPSEGRILLGDTDITDLPPYQRPVHTVFQSYALFPHLTVRQNVAYPLRMRRLAKRTIDASVSEFLDRVGVTAFTDRLPHQLSGGQRQRVALARALVGQPQLVLLDEPLGALDLKLREEMQIVLQHLQRDVGITFVYVTHDQGEALAMSDRIAIMADGRVQQIGTPEAVYARPETAFVARFVGRTNLLECRPQGGGYARSGELTFRVAEAPAGERFFISVRPECVRVGSAAAACENQMMGMVTEAIYQGADVELRLQAGGQQFIARSPVGRYAVGQSVALGWDRAGAVAVLPDPPTLEAVEI
jgi:spermidine/putrescine transport system ATP-binding protein